MRKKYEIVSFLAIISLLIAATCEFLGFETVPRVVTGTALIVTAILLVISGVLWVLSKKEN